jgi:hypothetical protein
LATVRRDSAVHVSLSSDSLVKQRGTSEEIPSPSIKREERAAEVPRIRRSRMLFTE